MQAVIDDTHLQIQNRAGGRGSYPRKTVPGLFFEYLNNLPANYPNYLTAPEPQRRHYSCRFLILSGLVLLCLIPRALISFQLSSVCPDGVLYIRLAEALNGFHFQRAFQEMNLNIYPVVLMVLNRLGLTWETGGMLWSVLMSSLVVLPLYGFVRRQFDDAVALVSCLLYAVHPIFIQWSPEIMRDPTFWLLFVLSLYLQWRAATEVRIGFLLAAGLATTLAVLTRFEGLFLMIPLCLWSFWRYRALISGREKAKLTAGLLFLAMFFPVLLLLINLTWFRNHPEWILPRFSPLLRISYWWNGEIASVPVVDASGAAVQGQAVISFGRMIAIYVPVLVKGLSPIFALLMLGGMWGWRGVWKRRDHQPLFYTALIVMLAAWIHTWCAQESCERYFLPIVLMASPFAALGLLALSKRILCFAERLNMKMILLQAAVFAPTAIVVIASWAIAFSGNFDRRGAEVELAAWVRQEFGPSAVLFGSEGITPVVAYYTRSSCAMLTKDMDKTMVAEKVQGLKPDVILLLTTNRNRLNNPRPLIDFIKELGYTEIERGNLPRGTDEALVVLRRIRDRPRVPVEASEKLTLQKSG